MKKMSVLFVRVGLLLIWANLLCGSAAFGGPMDLTGTFALSADRSDDVDEIVNASTASMNVLIRSIAHSRIMLNNPSYHRISIEHMAGKVRVQCDDSLPIDVSLKGPPTSWQREDGGRDEVTAQWESTRLVMLFTAGGDKRINTYVLAPDGNTMTLNVELLSSHLPGPIRYKLVYTRRT